MKRLVLIVKNMELNVEQNEQRVKIDYYSDVLCVWAYVAQIRLDELRHHFGDVIDINYHFMPVFGTTQQRIAEGMKDKGGFEFMNKHTLDVCADFLHVDIDPAVWLKVRPVSSVQTHLFIKALQRLVKQGVVSASCCSDYFGRNAVEEFIWRTRTAFFRDGENIADWQLLYRLAEPLGFEREQIAALLNNGEAMADLCHDKELCEQNKVEGSPTFILNEGRQKLYGNIGYKILESNVHEVIHRPYNQASWC